MKMAKGAAAEHSGSSFDDFLEEEGYRNEVESVAIKRVLAWQFEQEMIRQQKTKRAMAIELKTSRSQLDRLLDPQNTAVSLDTLTRAAHVLGKRLVLEIRDAQPQRLQAKRVGQRRTSITQRTASRRGEDSA
jgi:antitoxin HicB